MEPVDPPPVDPELARATAREILARAEYQPRPESLLRRFLRWLGELLDFRDPTPQPVGPAGPPGRLSPVAMAVLIVLLVLVAYLLYRLVLDAVAGRLAPAASARRRRGRGRGRLPAGVARRARRGRPA
ncbi:MAG: hypothetical protein R2755_34175 [Acidimicrobiales bacterium]